MKHTEIDKLNGNTFGLRNTYSLLTKLVVHGSNMHTNKQVKSE